MRWMVLAMVLMASLPYGATAGDDDPSSRGSGPRMMRDRGDAPSEAAIVQMREFMRLHSPRRMEMLQTLPENNPLHRGITRMMYHRWRALQGMREHDQELYTIKLTQLELEDQVWSLARQYRSAEEGMTRQQLHQELELAIGSLVDWSFQERDRRIQRLEQMLANERATLEEQRLRRPELVTERLKMELERDPEDLRGMLMNMLRRGDGPGDRRPEDRQEGAGSPTDGGEGRPGGRGWREPRGDDHPRAE